MPTSSMPMVEALGTAPKSYPTINSYQQTVPYLYHIEYYKSIPFFLFNSVFKLIVPLPLPSIQANLLF